MIQGAGALAMWALCSAAASEDAVVESAVRKFREDFYRLGAREDDRLSALHALSAHRHEKTVACLSPVLTRSVLPARILAARVLGQFGKVPAAARELRLALRSAANQTRKTAAVRIEILRSLGSLKAVEAAPEIDGLIEDREAWVAKAAIDAAGRLRQKGSVDELVKALRRLEGPSANAELGLDPIGVELGELSAERMLEGAARSERKMTERDFLREPLLGALREITRQNHTSAKSWEQWWSKSKTTFSVPE